MFTQPFVRVLGHDHVGGADVAAAVLVVPLGHRQLQHVDVVAGEHVLVERALVHVLRRDQRRVVEAFLPGGDELVAGDVGGQVGGEGGPLEGFHHAHQHPVAFGVVLDVVEQQRGGVLPAPGHLGQRADLQVPVAARNPAKLAHGIHLLEPLSEVPIHGGFPFPSPPSGRGWPRSVPNSTPLPPGEGGLVPSQIQPLSLWERVAEGRVRAPGGRVRAPQQPCPYIPLLHPMGCLRRGPSPQPSPRGRGGRNCLFRFLQRGRNSERNCFSQRGSVSPEGVGTASSGFSRGGRNCFSWSSPEGSEPLLPVSL